MIQGSTEGGAKLSRAQSRAADDVKGRCRKAALAEGLESPEAATDFIRKHPFGIEIGPQHFSATKSQLKRREGGGAPEGKRADERKAGPGSDTRFPACTRGSGSGQQSAGPAGHAGSCQELVEQHGADRVKRMVDLLGG